MKLNITYQPTYSKKELLLRTFFGFFYLYIPHLFMMGIFGIWSAIINMLSFWVILFTGRYPQSWFEYQVKMQRWRLRFQARTGNLADGYPAFNPSGTDDKTSLEIPYKEKYSRGKLLIRTFFGFFMAFPHVFVLIFRMWWGAILGMIAWWIILFTGKYPENWHKFNVENIRWATRLGCFLGNLIEDYPPFHGRDESASGASPAKNPEPVRPNSGGQTVKPVPPPAKPTETKSPAAEVKPTPAPAKPAEIKSTVAEIKPVAVPPKTTATLREIYSNRVSDATCTPTADNKFEVSFTVESRKYQVDTSGSKKEIPVNNTIEIGMLKSKPGSPDAEIYLKAHLISKTISKMTIVVNEQPDKIGIDPYNKLPEK